MPKRKRKRIYMDGDGVKYEIDGPEIDLGKGSLEDLLIDALGAEEDDEIIQKKAEELRLLFNEPNERRDTLHRWHEVGKVLRFVDDLNLRDDASRREAFQRLFKDLSVDLKRNPSLNKLTRYPNHMYRLAKLPQSLIFRKGMTWSGWFDILEYRRVCENPEILADIIHRCCEEKWNAKRLRAELQKLNKSLK